MNPNKKFADSKAAAPVIAALKAKPENQPDTRENGDPQGHNGVTPTVQSRVAACKTENSGPNVCPVTSCRKSFKFFRNLVAHVRAHGEHEEAKRFLEMQSKKVVCQYCRRQFVSVTHLNDHLQSHCGVKPYICIQLNCKASFLSNTELLVHRKEHAVFKARCMFPNCGRIFNEAFKLYDHEAQHYKTFTCKVPGCEKVFHSQTQLDLHQEEHATKEEVPVSPALEQQTSQNVGRGTSLIERMLLDHTPIKHEFPYASKNCNDESPCHADDGRVAQSIESLLNSSTDSALSSHGLDDNLEQYTVKSEPPSYMVKGEPQSYTVKSEPPGYTVKGEPPSYTVKSEPQNRPLFSVIQRPFSDHSVFQSSMNCHLSDPKIFRESSDARSFDYLKADPQNQHIPQFEANIDALSHSCHTHVLQGQPQMFSTNVNAGPVSYNNGTMPEQLQALCTNNPPQDSMPAVMSQPLPPTVTPRPPTGNRPENSKVSSARAVPPAGERERYHCALETCTRHYSCQKSAAKHMKTVHPDFYEQWKIDRKKMKVTRATRPSTLSLADVCTNKPVASLDNQLGIEVPIHRVQRQNVIQPSPYSNIVPNSNYAAPPSPSLSIPNHHAPLHMENVLDPIVLSQLGITPVQSQVAANQNPNSNWHSGPGDKHIQNSGSAQVYPSNMQGMPHMADASGALPLGLPSCSMMGSSMSSPAQPLHSPSYMDSTKGVSQHMRNSLLPFTSAISKSKTMQNHVPVNLLSSNSACPASQSNKSQNSQLISISRNIEEIPTQEKKKKQGKRSTAKWPAIIKDGKFICCKCFRAFNSASGLGGHLSKPSFCKGFPETDLNTDLPMSFLDLLNSEQTENNIQVQPPLSFDPAADFQEKPCQAGNSDLIGTKDFATPNYTTPQANLPAYGNGDSNEDILKQIMADSNMADLFDQPPVHPPLFQNPCVPYGAVERLPGSSVIQHTGSLQVKREDNSYTGHYPQSTVVAFGNSDFPDPLLSQILSENSSSALPARAPTDLVTPGAILSDGYCSGTISQTPDRISIPVKQNQLPEPQLSPASTSGKQTKKQRGTEQNVRKRLREQILAGDFQRRSSLGHSVNTDPNAILKSPMSLGPTCSQLPPDGKLDTASGGQMFQTDSVIPPSGGQMFQTDSVIPPASSGQIQDAVNMQSFTSFREAYTPQHDVFPPTEIVASDVDFGPTQLTASQQQCMMEIQNAFERLDLVREMCDQTASPIKVNSNNIHHEARPIKVESHSSAPQSIVSVSPQSTYIKRFACEIDNCTFRSMSSDALWKHLSKSHDYTCDMINAVKRKKGLYAPFSCQKCNKRYTRTSNLRTHYKSAHQLSDAECADLEKKRKLAKADNIENQNQSSAGGNPAPVAQTTIPSHSLVDDKTFPYPLKDIKQEDSSPAFGQRTNMDITNPKLQDDNHSTGFHPQQTIHMHHKEIPAKANAQTSKLAVQPLQPGPAAQHLQPGPAAQRLQPGPAAGHLQPGPAAGHLQPGPAAGHLQPGPAAQHWPDGQRMPFSTMLSQYVSGQQAGAHLPVMSTHPTQGLPAPLQASMSQSPDKQPNINKQAMVKTSLDVTKKTKEKKPKEVYKPYCCVHQGCVAAFTIQQNLILHYRTVHQSALSVLEVNKEHDQPEGLDEAQDHDDELEGEVPQFSEFTCQDRDCSRVFQEVPSLLQHYLQLHEFSLDRAGTLLSSINLGRFACGQQGCTALFTAFWKYIAHVKEEHNEVMLSKIEQVDGMFACDIEGCDRAYATKSNLLRHTMKKHHDIYRLKLMNQQINRGVKQKQNSHPHYQITKTSNGKENIESNKKKMPQSDKKKSDKTTDKATKNSHWSKYGKPCLKSKEQASAMCTKNCVLQYPCMIKGCDSVMKSERSIMKHYMGHGLSEKYLEEQRSHLIFCKKRPRQKSSRSDDSKSSRSDDSKSENSSDPSETEDAAEGSDEDSKPVLRKRVAAEIPSALLDGKLSNDESSDACSDDSVVVRRNSTVVVRRHGVSRRNGVSRRHGVARRNGAVVVKRKRGRPRKLMEEIVKRKKFPRSTKSHVVYNKDDESDSSSCPAPPQEEAGEETPPLTSFKPMGFEMSFLKFLEQSNKSEPMKRKVELPGMLRKRTSSFCLDAKETCVDFSNRQNLISLKKVRIVVDGAYSDVADLLLKQIQDMRPTVILEKND